MGNEFSEFTYGPIFTLAVVYSVDQRSRRFQLMLADRTDSSTDSVTVSTFFIRSVSEEWIKPSWIAIAALFQSMSGVLSIKPYVSFRPDKD